MYICIDVYMYISCDVTPVPVLERTHLVRKTTTGKLRARQFIPRSHECPLIWPLSSITRRTF
jgi:hypothetical protein